MKRALLHSLKLATSIAICVIGVALTSPAFTQNVDMQDVNRLSDAIIAEWLGGLFFLSLAVMAALMHWAGHIVMKGVKPEVKAKYGRYAGTIALFFDQAVLDDYLKRRNALAIYVRLAALTSVLLFVSHIYFKY